MRRKRKYHGLFTYFLSNAYNLGSSPEIKCGNNFLFKSGSAAVTQPECLRPPPPTTTTTDFSQVAVSDTVTVIRPRAGRIWGRSNRHSGRPLHATDAGSEFLLVHLWIVLLLENLRRCVSSCSRWQSWLSHPFPCPLPSPCHRVCKEPFPAPRKQEL